MPQFFLGVDGGQSSTKAILGDADGRVIGRGSSGPCNHVHGAERETRLTRVLSECVAEACKNAGITGILNEFQSACFGFSGGAADKRALVERTFHCEHLLVTDDATVALTGATHGAPGVLVLAGTGSIAFGRNAAGQTARAGGWGYLYGDEGSAFDLVRQALRAALRMEEGWGPVTALREKLLHACGTAGANDLLHRFYTPEWPRDKVAGLAPWVETAAAEGDSIATELLQAAAQQLALLAMAVRRQIFTADEPARVAYAGGVFESPAILERFRTLVELEEGIQCVPPLLGPAEGALLEAYRLAGLFQPEMLKSEF